MYKISTREGKGFAIETASFFNFIEHAGHFEENRPDPFGYFQKRNFKDI